jgi:hypothetical protein
VRTWIIQKPDDGEKEFNVVWFGAKQREKKRRRDEVFPRARAKEMEP